MVAIEHHGALLMLELGTGERMAAWGEWRVSGRRDGMTVVMPKTCGHYYMQLEHAIEISVTISVKWVLSESEFSSARRRLVLPQSPHSIQLIHPLAVDRIEARRLSSVLSQSLLTVCDVSFPF